MQKRSSACLIRMPSDLCISFYCLFLMSTQTPNYLLIPKLQWVMMEALHLLFVFLRLSQCSAGSYFNLKCGLVLFGMHATSLPWVPLPKPCCYQLCCMSDSLRRWRDAENYNSHSHSSLLRHKALQRLNFNFSLLCIHSSDLWSKIKSWFPNPHKSNHIRSLLVHEVASCPQTRDRFNVEITVARISLKSLPYEENWLQGSTLPKPWK